MRFVSLWLSGGIPRLLAEVGVVDCRGRGWKVNELRRSTPGRPEWTFLVKSSQIERILLERPVPGTRRNVVVTKLRLYRLVEYWEAEQSAV
jgi:hypothetical protein